MSHPFDPNYTPPFPSLPVIARNAENNKSTPMLTAYLDTGADGTLWPFRYLRALEITKMYPMRLRSHWGESRIVYIYTVDLEVAGYNFPGVEVVADDQGKQVLLGRNLLNRLLLLLDGPRNQVDILLRRPLRF